MTATTLVVFFCALALGVGGAAWTTRRFDLRRPNFRQERIPAVSGLVLVIAGVFFYGADWLRPGVGGSGASPYLLVTLAFGVLGLADDALGDRSIGGFRGHIRALLQGKFTTGFAKLLGGGVVSLVAGFMLYSPRVWHALLASLVIALTANMLNLLDIRPGRCLAGFLLGAASVVACLLVRHHLDAGFLFFFVVAVAVILYPFDATGRVMLGDTGSNAFGALLGVAVAQFASASMQIAAVIAMVLFQAWCERNSFNAAIERSPILRSIDRKIGVR